MRSSFDSFASDLVLVSVPDNTDTRTGQTITLTSSFDDLDTATEFRIFAYNAESGAGTWRLDNIAFNGSISEVPEPTTFIVAALGLFGLCIYRQRSK